jgi:hypothetical protein
VAAIVDGRALLLEARVRRLHHQARQLFVLSGLAVLGADGTEHRLQAGEGSQILVIARPHSHGDREVVE